MKQQKLIGYQPNYPKKVLRSAAMTAAAMVAIGGMTGCVKVKVPGIELQTEGMVAVPEPTEEPALQGKVLVTEPPEEVLVLDGEVAICEPEETPEPTAEPITTTGMVYVPEDNNH